MIAKLPEGGEWPVDQQVGWLNLMAMAFGTVYGGDAASRLSQGRSTPQAPIRAVAAPAHKPGGNYSFMIDEEGFARTAGRKRINVTDVTGEIVDLRGMDGDMKSIIWADGSTGLNGADLTIVAG
jgi:hypothetical protein